MTIQQVSVVRSELASNYVDKSFILTPLVFKFWSVVYETRLFEQKDYEINGILWEMRQGV